MSKPDNYRTKPLAWNGMKLLIPNSWESRFPKNQHIVFEKDFTPQLQLRWEKTKQPNPDNLRKKLIEFSGSTFILEEETLPQEWSAAKDKFDLLLLVKNENLTSGIFYYKEKELIVLFEILDRNPSILKEAAQSITSLNCRSDGYTSWQIQDFSFETPPGFALQNYSFAAGLTRLSFKTAELDCHVCRLGPADQRLEQQSLTMTLDTLVGAKTGLLERQIDNNTYSLKREPSVWQQIRYRLRRRPPFILAEIYHDEQSNHLLAVVLSAKLPIAIHPACIFNK